ncbi:hypothetical protein Hdeb2414_s0100g00793441 [Helianthus debilis subsp. tardiflorus]
MKIAEAPNRYHKPLKAAQRGKQIYRIKAKMYKADEAIAQDEHPKQRPRACTNRSKVIFSPAISSRKNNMPYGCGHVRNRVIQSSSSCRMVQKK